MAHGKICYLEIPANRAEDSARFDSEIFGWKRKCAGRGANRGRSRYAIASGVPDLRRHRARRRRRIWSGYRVRLHPNA